MPHVVLIGDSIIDNAMYVPDGPCVTDQLRGRLPRDWQVTMLARDGDVVAGAIQQLKRLPPDASHLVVSAGGNDALSAWHIVGKPLADSAAMLAELAAAQLEFRNLYRQLAQAIRATRLPAIAFTVYDAVPDLRDVDRMALSLFNECIMRELVAAGLPILDLRLVCDQPHDYSAISPIESSERGGAKITLKLQSILLSHDFTRAESVVFGGV